MSKEVTPKNILILFALASLGLTVSAFFIEHILAAAPCQMCWWQRYAHWAVGIIAVLGLVVSQYKVALSGILLSAGVGLYVACWQVLAQHGILNLPSSCTGNDNTLAMGNDLLNSLSQAQNMPACNEVGFTIFGLSLATWNILIMLSMVLLSGYVIIKRK